MLCSFEDGLKLVKLRGESMQAAADAKPSAMVSVIGLSMDKVSTHQTLQNRRGACGIHRSRDSHGCTGANKASTPQHILLHTV